MIGGFGVSPSNESRTTRLPPTRSFPWHHKSLPAFVPVRNNSKQREFVLKKSKRVTR
jgi:hypothetical protein